MHERGIWEKCCRIYRKENITDELSVILKKIYRDILRGERIWTVKGNRIVLDDI